MTKELKKRSEVEVENTWKVSDIYPTVEDWEKDLKEISKLAQELSQYQNKIGSSAENLLKVCQKEDELGQKLTSAYNYASRIYDADTTNFESQALLAKVSSLYANVSAELAFVNPELIDIEEETLTKFYSESADLRLYEKSIAETRRLKAHILPAQLNKIVAMTEEMASTPSNVFGILSNADLQFAEVENENGETVRMTSGNFVSLLESKNRSVRENAFKKFYATYKQYLNTFAALYNGQIKQQIFSAKASKYNSTLECAVDGNNVPATVYHTLIDTVNANLEPLHRYVQLRKKLLGVDELHMYDIYTPMIADAAKKIDFAQAKETVLKALAVMGKDYTDKLKEGFDNRWIDVYENVGKRSGAYSATAYGSHPYVLLNYVDNLDSVFTLAHEMGHSLHSYYSNLNQPFVYSQYRIFVAEVASTTNEVLLLKYLLQNSTDKKEKAYLLNHFLDMFKGTLYRQTQFAEFEMKTNEMVEKGEDINAQNATELYYQINKKYYGDEMISDQEIGYEWARIPHFYYNFYVYQYATSFATSVAVAQKILAEGEPMVKKYKEFLSSGCSDTPINLLKKLGVDLEKPEPIISAINVMNDTIDQLEDLLK